MCSNRDALKSKNKSKNKSFQTQSSKKASKQAVADTRHFCSCYAGPLSSIFLYLGNLLPYELCISKINPQIFPQCPLQLAQTHVTRAPPASSLTGDFDLEVSDLRKLVPHRKGWLVRAVAESGSLGGWPQD